MWCGFFMYCARFDMVHVCELCSIMRSRNFLLLSWKIGIFFTCHLFFAVYGSVVAARYIISPMAIFTFIHVHDFLSCVYIYTEKKHNSQVKDQCGLGIYTSYNTIQYNVSIMYAMELIYFIYVTCVKEVPIWKENDTEKMQSILYKI